MTVKELIENLKKIPDKDTEIEIEDSYWRSEGYGENADDDASSQISVIRFHDGKYILESEDDYPWWNEKPKGKSDRFQPVTAFQNIIRRK